MAHYLITGGCGFIGSHLADALLAAGHGVRILDDLSTGKRENAPPAAEIMIGDVADPVAVAESMAGMDGCFHLAAVASVQRSVEDWLGTHRTNQTGAVQIFNAARNPNGAGSVPVVYASSAAVFGDNANVPLDEAAACAPLTAYGADKLGCELHARVAAHVHGIPTAGMRFFNVFGPRQDPSSPYSGVISIFVDRIKRGEEITIFGDGGQTRDFIYVADVVAYLMRAMETASTAEARVFNIGVGRELSILNLAKAVMGVCGRESPILHAEPRSGDIRISLSNPSKAQTELGFTAEMAFADGLKKTLQDD